jgi:hypothetical protein
MKACLNGKAGEGQGGCRRDTPVVGVASNPRSHALTVAEAGAPPLPNTPRSYWRRPERIAR